MKPRGGRARRTPLAFSALANATNALIAGSGLTNVCGCANGPFKILAGHTPRPVKMVCPYHCGAGVLGRRHANFGRRIIIADSTCDNHRFSSRSRLLQFAYRAGDRLCDWPDYRLQAGALPSRFLCGVRTGLSPCRLRSCVGKGVLARELVSALGRTYRSYSLLGANELLLLVPVEHGGIWNHVAGRRCLTVLGMSVQTRRPAPPTLNSPRK